MGHAKKRTPCGVPFFQPVRGKAAVGEVDRTQKGSRHKELLIRRFVQWLGAPLQYRWSQVWVQQSDASNAARRDPQIAECGLG